MPNQTTSTAGEYPGGPPPGLGLARTFRWAVNNPPTDPTVSFAGKTVLVTGANTGLGFEAALKYAALGAERLCLGVRSLEKGEAAKQRILQCVPDRAPDSISVLHLDQSSFFSVQAFAHTLADTAPRLDVALLNAGVMTPQYTKTPDGWETALQVNVLSSTLLAILLLPLLRAASAPGTPSHLTLVNSIAHSLFHPSYLAPGQSLLDLANNEASRGALTSYAGVKLLGLAAMQGLARATNAKEVVVNAVCPSLCKTELGREFGMVIRVVMALQNMVLARTAEEGSSSLVSATALSGESHGGFWSHDVLFPVSEMARDEEFMKRTWDDIWEVLLSIQDDVSQILNKE